MKLERIEIRNFRSIESATIHFDQNCKILLGKNEAGKSNVLKAIAALFERYQVTERDRRKKIDNEVIKEYYLRAVLSFNILEIDEIIRVFRATYQGIENIHFKNGMSFEQYVEEVFGEILIDVIIEKDAKPYLTYWDFQDHVYELSNSLFLDGKSIVLSNTGVPFVLDEKVALLFYEEYRKKPIKCYYWQYSNDYLLPASIDIDSFINSPNRYPALANIFYLAGRVNIADEFKAAKAEDGDYLNLFEQISKKVTHTFRSIWKDFHSTSIQLIPNGAELAIKVVDKAKYTFEDRSDGFKKFISVLLMLSTQSRSNRLSTRDLILFDEPDQSLYPTSARYLRDELLEISKKTKIVYSTHSQYMIDSNNIFRHILVEKKDDITRLRIGSDISPFADDELLRRAIGTSIFDVIREKNVIFEGYLDRELFSKYVKYQKSEADFKEYGTVYLSGISGVETLVQLMILADKRFVIVADSDNASRSKREDFVRNYPEYKNSWMSYGDICKGVETMEDFFTHSHILNQIIVNGYGSFKFDEKKSAIHNIEHATGADKIVKQKIKNDIVSSLTKTNLLPEYGSFVSALKDKIVSL